MTRNPRVTVSFDETSFTLSADGRSAKVPFSAYPRLLDATPAQRESFELSGGGEGIHWPDIDEDLNIERLLADWGDAHG
jgi:hypothetical protein